VPSNQSSILGRTIHDQELAEGGEYGTFHDERDRDAWLQGDLDQPAARSSFPAPVTQSASVILEAHITEDFNAEFQRMNPFGHQIARALHTGLSVLVKSSAAGMAALESNMSGSVQGWFS